MRCLAILLLSATLARAEEDVAGRFDYYLLSLSWAPSWCAAGEAPRGAARQSPQCAPGGGAGWVLHGLWPQYERGWPSYCRSTEADPSRSQIARLAELTGSPPAAWHQWKKHGRCSGLSAGDYAAAARRAYEAVSRPAAFGKLTAPVRLPAGVVEEAFLQANPGLLPDMLTVTCKAGRIREVRICLTKALRPRPCAPDTVEDCELRDALMPPPR
ncbi:ribonuclease T2 family protein [Rhodovulum sulfidophilum]|uniref:ribonuclease T2 family protein n=1 Tax=Rhodovulum sulfidophilum TaxID=35806 RepID=UPI000950F068|nr:ribonuclease T [Rhodovulum sulfidophilum]OLS52967.1 ribonuclease T [Rhodovulum sulfidophilum]